MGRLAIRAGRFRSDAELGKTVDVTWTGECELDAIAELDPFFAALHTVATSTKPPRDVVFDMKGVAFMSSVCIARIVAWLARVRALDASARYHVHFRLDPKAAWQKRSLRAIESFAPELVTLER